MKFFTWILFSISVLFFGCDRTKPTDSIATNMGRYEPIPLENMIMLEVDSSRSVSQIIGSLDHYRSNHINTLCVNVLQYSSEALHTLVDSCHQASINVMLHSNIPNEVKTVWVTDFDVDGFHCRNISMQSVGYWQKKIDSLRKHKKVMMIADDAVEDRIASEFSAGFGNKTNEAILNVFDNNEPVSIISNALNEEKNIFSKTFASVRTGSLITSKDSAAQFCSLLISCSLLGVPCLTEEQLYRFDSFLQPFLSLYANSSLLQYGEYELCDSGSPDVFMIIRSFEEEKILFVINTRNKPASYNWPLNLMGIQTKLLFGEKISRNGGQELSPYGYQVIKFESVGL